MRTIAVVNQKGGCGKTTTTINLAGFLALEGRKTLIVDMDPQGHSTLGLLTDTARLSKTMHDVFVEHFNGRDTRLPDIIRSIHQSLDLAPADIMLSAVPEKLSGLPGRERVLTEVLDDVEERYDYVLVDCPPHVGLLTFNALSACSEAIVPVDPSFFSLHGIGKLLETFDVLARTTGHEIAMRALITLYVGRSQFSKAVVEDIRKHLPGRCFTTVIRHSVKLAEAASHGLPIARYCYRCAGFEDYEALTAELLQLETSSASDAPATRGRQIDVLQRPTAPTLTPGGVFFALEAPNAQRVQLVGDFNGWTPDGSEMTPSGKVWTSKLKLEPGRYRYRYIIDGDWCRDPLNVAVEACPYGGDNSVLVVGVDSESEALDVR
jgi:chromosome partitioning protein